MSEPQVPASPEGVPGAVLDPTAIRVEDLTFRGATRTPWETRVEVYEGAGHAFFADDLPSYRPEPTAKPWERIVQFLQKHLGE